MLYSSKLPENLWGEAITHAVWVKNRTITHGLPKGKMPYKMLYEKKPSMSGLYEWGNKVWIHTPGGSKLMDVQKLIDGSGTMRSAMGTEYIGPINAQ